jgi:exosortase A-associated hydrolase 2
MSREWGDVRPHFVQGAHGNLFVLLRCPAGRSSGPAVLFVPPFGEEMNKMRRMFALTAMALNRAGVAAVLVDPFGTGDSAGEFREATWSGWIDDLGAAAKWAAGEGWRVDRLLAARLGCALAAEAAGRLPLPLARTVFWQPVLDGKRFLTQLLRTRAIASEMSDRRETVSELRAMLAAGNSLEIAGYDLSPALVASIESLTAPFDAGQLGILHWFEIVREISASPRTSTAEIRMKLSGLRSVTTREFEGEPFWSTVEVVTVPSLVEVSAAALGESP